MQQPSPGAITAGDVAPQLSLADAAGTEIDLYDDAFAGRPQAWLLHGPQHAAQAAACAERLHASLDAALPRLLCVTIGRNAPPAAAAGQEPAWQRATLALQARGDALPGEGGDLVGIAVAPNGHVRAVLRDMRDPVALGDALAAALEVLVPSAEVRPGGMHPPVLMVPDVLSPADCKRLMTVYTMRGQKFVEPGHNVAGQTTDYKMRIPDYGREDRIDHWVIDQDTNALIDSRFQARLLPVIQKAFQYRITRRETYRIARYGGDRGGRPIPHRDNTEPAVAHRRFAVTVNLNTESFEGGSLRFPEFSEHRYRPETGAAIVFSCSLLHEVMAVESGTRFALLGFVYGDS